MERKLNILIVDTIKPGKEGTIERIIKDKLIPALRKQLPKFRWKIYRPLVGGNMSRMILIAAVTEEQLLNYDQWIITALQREHGTEEVAKYLQEWYECLISSEYTGVLEDPDWSNF